MHHFPGQRNASHLTPIRNLAMIDTRKERTTMDNPIYRQEERDQQLIELCGQILSNARNELYLHMRFLDVALSSLRFTPDFGVNPAATEGIGFYYHPEHLITLYKKDRKLINRLYLHLIFHCLFAHMFVAKGRDPSLWNLSCDIAAEYVMDDLYLSCVYRSRSQIRRRLYSALRQHSKVITAQGVYDYLQRQNLSQEHVMQLAHEFYVDDHSIWNEKPENPNRQQQQKWEDIREKMQTEMETFSKEASENSKSLYEQICIENRQRYDYKEFLRKFCVLKEEMQVDMDSFDYIFYNYGMEMYGNMPLIEPQETKEVHKIEDFVIVIDTSMSCKGELVQHFLEETYSVLNEAESFARQIHVHLIQCDERIQNDTLITSREQMKEYMKHFQIVGQGGTDFRPAFAYVNELLAAGKFHRLRGLIYFTDGYGTYPVKKPIYETAFVFMKEDYQDVDVPPWAIKLILDTDQLKRSNTL